MSDMQQGPGWWQASDGKWYPPESHPAHRTPPPVPYPNQAQQMPAAGYLPPAGPSIPSTPYSVPSPYSAPPTGAPPWGPPYAPYGVGPPGAPFVTERRTSGLAIASFVCSVVGIIPFFFGLSCVAGIVLGFVALAQIKRTGGAQQGRGLAIAGVVIGFSLIAIFVVIVIVAVATGHTSQTS